MFKSPFSSEGRIRRKEYGITLIVYTILATLVNTLSSLAQLGNTSLDMDAAIGIVTLLLYIPILWLLHAQGAKRCHDVGKAAWWQLIPFYPFVLLFRNGIKESNEYGVNPKADPTVTLIDAIGRSDN
ncbi:Uncharacterized membrane protein YhaH, DUF805 family [Chitinophaga sp. CF118]|uniref:DUF805 domain-containing protein n=1 Tax=Chitinophaga sp. CF118 TaxID=1884367 RepID=UPI0008E86B01|nr:DUF805 domain-containing protein [Chitinophaga sp. CF118]SFD15416.1 Uncharacterized membrane protein YhaH, DUF805 family [Chitinophaga sp. CF118]